MIVANCHSESGPISVRYLHSVTRAQIVTYFVDKEPMLCIDSFLIEEKGGTDEALIEKIGC